MKLCKGSRMWGQFLNCAFYGIWYCLHCLVCFSSALDCMEKPPSVTLVFSFSCRRLEEAWLICKDEICFSLVDVFETTCKNYLKALNVNGCFKDSLYLKYKPRQILIMKKANKWPFLHFFKVNAVLNFSSVVFFWNVKDHMNESRWIRLCSLQTQPWCCSSVWIHENYFFIYSVHFLDLHKSITPSRFHEKCLNAT